MEVSGCAKDAVAVVGEHVQSGGRAVTGTLGEERVVAEGSEEEEGRFCVGRHGKVVPVFEG